ncbi:hypothetical protein INT48_004636 [Thamnidium elegans]|uniref:Uncharacterized protein n=1 Tax=Thamnidium elegans TaxID=101142 RepID=A0A8H7SU98_9FUNG|nr:hypothetical protein INT48_004636 [Thamnidium elegans]
MNEAENIQERYIQLVRDITKLQWVRESIASHSKNYEGLKKKIEKQLHLKEFSEKELNKYRMEKDFPNKSNKNGTRTLRQVTESVRFYEIAVRKLQVQVTEARIMELNEEKDKLDELCKQLHLLYDQVVVPGTEDIFEQHLRNDVEQLNIEIPDIESKIKLYKQAQTKLYKARELIDIAMKTLPGSTSFMDKQALSNVNSHAAISGYSFKNAWDPISKANELSQRGYKLVKVASELCPDDVPNIPNTTNFANDDVLRLLTNYRGYRLKIESVLRKQLNPRLNSFENQLVMSKYHFEQRTVEWVDRQVTFLESYLRANGFLENQNLDREISMLRMGSRAAVTAVAEASDRVTVDDALNISTEDNGALPEYEYNGSLLHNNDLPPPAYSR